MPYINRICRPVNPKKPKSQNRGEKLAALGTLMAGVAHEINNPTHFVSVSGQNLAVELANCRQFIFDLAGEDADEAILDSFRCRFESLELHINTILDGTERIKAIVKDLKTSSYAHDSEKTTVCITDLIDATVNLVKAKYAQQIELQTQYQIKPQVTCYPAKLNQVFMNLLVNAAQSIQQKAEQLGDAHHRGNIVISCTQHDSQIHLGFNDDGGGMSDDTLNHLFEPFYTTKGIEQGTGLGLWISYDIIRQHQGELTVTSELGVGTIFTLILPLQ